MVTTTETSIRFRCANGHQLRAALSLAGTSAACPACSVPVVIGGEARESITDTGAFQLLNECDAAAIHDAQEQFATSTVPSVVEQRSEKRCPRCRYPIDTELLICPHCRRALEASHSLLTRIYRTELRSIR